VPILQLEPRSDIEVDADDLLKAVENASKTQDCVQTSDISDGSPTQVRKKMQDASTLPCITHTAFGASLVLEEKIGSRPKVERLEDYQVEVPIIASSPESEQKPRCGKRVAFKDVYEEFIDFPTSDIEDAEINLEDSDNNALSRPQDYENVIHDEIKNEKPDINDKDLRVDIPQLKVQHFTDPRLQHSPREVMKQVNGTKQIQLMTEDPKAEMKMNWIAIPPTLAQMNLTEDVDDCSSGPHFVEKPRKVVRSEQLLYKDDLPLVLALDEEEDEEMEEDLDLAWEVEALHQVTTPKEAKLATTTCPKVASATQNIECEPYPMESLLSKPLKRRLEVCMNGGTWPNTQSIAGPMPSAKRLKFANTAFTSESSHTFSAVDSVDAYLNLRGGRFKKPAFPNPGYNNGCHPLLPSSTEAGDPIFTSQAILDAPPRERDTLKRAGSFRHPEASIEVPSTPGADCAVQAKMVAPAIDPLPGPRTIMIDSTLVNDRGLIEFLERHGGADLTVMYRDFHGCPDMILEPKTCLTYTNLQALSQKNLPGQSAKPNALQSRLRALSQTYDTVFVLISMPTSCRSSALTQLSMMGDFAALCGSFVSGSTGRIVPIWVPSDGGGGVSRSDTSLFAWTWSLICLNAFDGKVKGGDYTESGLTVPVIQEETLWELFLRKAGLNAMASQVVLGMLRKPDNALERLDRNLSNSDDSERSWGLGKFVSMKGEQRMKMFGPVVGEKNVERLNAIFAASRENKESNRVL
jgi:hypothetical protein